MSFDIPNILETSGGNYKPDFGFSCPMSPYSPDKRKKGQQYHIKSALVDFIGKNPKNERLSNLIQQLVSKKKVISRLEKMEHAKVKRLLSNSALLKVYISRILKSKKQGEEEMRLESPKKIISIEKIPFAEETRA